MNRLKEIEKEVHGDDYIRLMYKQEETPQESLRKAKLILIEDINKCRKLMGDKPCVDSRFYEYYDKSIDELHRLIVIYTDDAHHYIREQKLNSNSKKPL